MRRLRSKPRQKNWQCYAYVTRSKAHDEKGCRDATDLFNVLVAGNFTRLISQAPPWLSPHLTTTSPTKMISVLLSRANAHARKGAVWNADGNGILSTENIVRNQMYSLLDTINNACGFPPTRFTDRGINP